jgi:ferredoxin
VSAQHDVTAVALTVDRIACTGHGVCASLLPGSVGLDEWGYPVLHSTAADPDLGDVAIRMCPARALSWTRRAHR